MLIILILNLLSVPFWSIVFRRLRAGQPPLPFTPRPSVSWGLIDIVGAVALMMLLGTVSTNVLGRFVEIGESPETMSSKARVGLIAASGIATLLTTIISAAFILLRNGFNTVQLGWSWQSLRADLKLGVGAFLLLVGPTLTIQFFFVVMMGIESSHPLVEVLKENVLFFPICAISAVIIAPICEEYLFRVLCQGWMQKVSWEDVDGQIILMGEPQAVAGSVSDQPAAGDSSLVEQADASNPYRPPLSADHNEVAKSDDPGEQRLVLLPIVLSSLLFALLHYSHGPDWIALFFLAMGLGYIFQRTHRILPCIVVHLLLNALSMTMVLLSMLFGQ